MKKFIAITLLLAMSLALFAGCAGDTKPTEAPKASELASAKAYLLDMYRKTDGKVTTQNYEVLASVKIGETVFPVEWAIEVTAGEKEAVKVGETKDNMVNIEIVNKEPAEEVQYKLTATIKDADGKTETISIKHSIPKSKNVGKPVEGVAYKLSVAQNKLKKVLYFTGKSADKEWYLATTENPAEAVDVYVEVVDGGYRMYYTIDGQKMYIDMYTFFDKKKEKDKGSLKLTTEPSVVYKYDEEAKTMIGDFGEKGSYYMGCYNEFNTISTSSTFYITGENASKIGTEQFVAQLVTVPAK